jgi:hypothetical protein
LVLKIVEQEICSTVLKTWRPVPVISSLVLIKIFIFLDALKLIEEAQYRSFFIQGFLQVKLQSVFFDQGMNPSPKREPTR